MLLGTNDIVPNTDDAVYQTSLSNILDQLLNLGIKPIVLLTPPTTVSTDIQADGRRTRNASAITTIVNKNAGIKYYDLDELVGQIRVSTGEKDDIKTSFNADGVHFTVHGNEAIAKMLNEKFVRNGGLL